jgi:hypothetical protein
MLHGGFDNICDAVNVKEESPNITTMLNLVEISLFSNLASLSNQTLFNFFFVEKF